MKKNQLKDRLMPLIRECVEEILFEEDMLSEVIKEMMFRDGVLARVIGEVQRAQPQQVVMMPTPAAPMATVVSEGQENTQSMTTHPAIRPSWSAAVQPRHATPQPAQPRQMSREEREARAQELNARLERGRGTSKNRLAEVAGIPGVFEGTVPLESGGRVGDGSAQVQASSGPLGGLAEDDAGIDLSIFGMRPKG